MKTNKGSVAIALLIAVIVAAGVVYFGWVKKDGLFVSSKPAPASTAATTSDVVSQLMGQNQGSASTKKDIETVADNLEIPWDFAFMPDGKLLVTERVGTLVLVDEKGNKTTVKIPRVVPKGEGGLLGITLHPDYANNHKIYLYMSTTASKTGTTNAVFQYTFNGSELTGEKTIIKDIPGALYHDGGRLEFGPDGFLYITTGDATKDLIAQDKKSLGGKILRVTEDGKIPADNPFKTAVYSYGHRNPQGLAWDSDGRLWETEHGRSGVVTGMDEINLVVKGANYGWPKIEGSKSAVGMLPPIYNSGATTTWAPASALIYNGNLFYGGLKGESLYEAVLDGNRVTQIKEHLKGEYGRIRTVRLGPDGMLYFSTSNRDGRGNPRDGDDKIVRVNPEVLKER